MPFYLTIHRQDRVSDFLLALHKEMTLWANELGEVPISTVYFGGGTPTSLQPEQLVKILNDIYSMFRIVSEPEITVEASPDTVTVSDLRTLRKVGVNRLSLGAQTFEKSEWEHLGRLGHRYLINKSVDQARQVGFENINIDLIYGLPEQTLESWHRSLVEVIALNPTHVSCYALTLEEGTQFYHAHSQGSISVADVELEKRMSGIAQTELSQGGFEHYEISNYSQEGYKCQHNLRYWLSKSYLGLGPSAQSYVGPFRFGNVGSLNEYCESLTNGQLPLSSWETLLKEEVDRERVVFGLRLLKGLNINYVGELKSDEQWQSTVQMLIENGFLSDKGQTLQLTAFGRDYADSVAVELL